MSVIIVTPPEPHDSMYNQGHNEEPDLRRSLLVPSLRRGSNSTSGGQQAGKAINSCRNSNQHELNSNSTTQPAMPLPARLRSEKLSKATTTASMRRSRFYHTTQLSTTSDQPHRTQYSFDSTGSGESGGQRRGPTAVHISFSAENLGPRSYSPVWPRASAREWRKKHLIQAEIGDIGADYMRVSGAIRSFHSLLSSASMKTRGSHHHSHRAGSPTSKHPDSGHAHPKPLPRLSSLAVAKIQRPNISYRLGRRKELLEKRRKACDWSLVFALLGIGLMIMENELAGARVYDKKSVYSDSLKALIVLSTVFLLAMIVAYHALEIQLFMVDNSADDWRIAVGVSRVSRLSAELFACAVCPIPGALYFTWFTVHSDGVTKTAPSVSLDVALSIPMFLRLYLICRVMLLHNRLFTDASSRSIGALNRIDFNARFVLKTLMKLCPGLVLLIFTTSFWLISAWIMRLCERYHAVSNNGTQIVEAAKFENYLNNLWLVAITFLSVGYGDMVPNTYCGRAVSVIAGIMGAGTSSLVVAVIARKLQLSRAEQHVHNFMMDTQLTKRLKAAAANVLRETWLIYKHRRLMSRLEPAKVRYHQRKFLMAIYELRHVKRDQRKLAENSATVQDVARSSATTMEICQQLNHGQQSVDERLASLEQRMTLLTDLLQKALNVAPV